MIDPEKHNVTDEMVMKIMNSWFPKDEPLTISEITDNYRSFAYGLIQNILYGDDAVLGQNRCEGVINVLKDYGIIDYSLTREKIWWEGKQKAAEKQRELWSSPEAQKLLSNILGLVSNISKEISEEKKKEHFITSTVASKQINKN